ncbi:MAG: AAA family ATPase [Candidatus Sericytochromatia bacterium]|nr:AAA family ATPase [Candidatus Sericytochromatia bacterium]
MKISKIIIPDYQEFSNFELDLTYPEDHLRAGKPLDKVCFIGQNGTGKSTILKLIQCSLRSISDKKIIDSEKIIIEFKEDNQDFELIDNSDYVIIYSPAESSENQLLGINDVPEANLNEALELFKKFDFFKEVSNSQVKEFWKLLIYLVKKRDEDYRTFENLEENQSKTVKQVKEEFNNFNPEILENLSGVWNKILYKAGLEFDYKNASSSIQLSDNLKDYIKLKTTGETIKYSDLSTGIRNFIFRIGYIYSLYFNRKINNGFLLIDEPENSLYPDFLYDLIDTYQQTVHDTQFFVATHSPIIASQFAPEERIILEFDDQGKIIAHRGITPIGDDSNDLLINDFNVKSIYGKEGLEKWDRFIELKRLIKQEQNAEQKIKLMKEYLKIGNAYNFSDDEVFN